MKESSFYLRGIDDLTTNFVKEFEDSIDSEYLGILGLGIGLEEICNYKCRYCYAGRSGIREYEQKIQMEESRIMSLDEYENVIQQAAKHGAKTVVISGNGEPFMSRKIIKIIQLSNAHDMSVVIFTNGSILGDSHMCELIHRMSTKELVKFLAKTDTSLMIKCDTLDPAFYKEITGYDHSVFSEAIKNIESEFLNEKKISSSESITNVGISMVITKVNYNEIQMMSEYFNAKGMQYICKFVSFMGNAQNNSTLFFTPEEAQERLLTALSFADKKETLLINGNYCLLNQLGLSLTNTGIPLLCLSGSPIEKEPMLTCLNSDLKDLIRLRKRVSPPKVGECPKKSQWYSFK